MIQSTGLYWRIVLHLIGLLLAVEVTACVAQEADNLKDSDNDTVATTSLRPSKSSGSFSGGSFFGGVVLGMVVLCVCFVAYKIWLRRRAQEAGYRSY